MAAGSVDNWLDGPEATHILFHPRPEPQDASPSGGERVRVVTADNGILGGWLFSSAPSHPLILFFHGNGEIALDYADLAPFFHHADANLLVMDYRGYGASSGLPTGSALMADAVECFQALPTLADQYDLAPRGIYVMGRSLGSAAALEIANRCHDGLDGLILDSAFADTAALLRRLGGPLHRSDPDDQQGFQQLVKMGLVAVPTLLIHGAEDNLIPVADAERLFERCPVTRKELLRIPGAGHNDLFFTGMQHYLAALQRFLT